MSGHQRSALYMVGFVFLWAFIELMGSVLLARYSAFQVVWMRYLVHLGLMVMFFSWRAPGSLLRTRRPGFQLLRSLMMLIMPASWVLATWMGAGWTAAGWFWTAPLMILAFSALLLRERSSPAVTLAAAVGGPAAAVLIAGLSLPAGWQWLPVVGMAASFGLYVVMTRSLRTEPLRANLFYTALGVFAALTPVVPFVWQTPGLIDLALFVAVGGFGLVCLWCLDRAVSNAPVSDTAPLLLAQVPFMVSLGWIAGHNAPDSRTLFLMAAIIIASAIPLVRIYSRFRVSVSQ